MSFIEFITLFTAISALIVSLIALLNQRNHNKISVMPILVLYTKDLDDVREYSIKNAGGGTAYIISYNYYYCHNQCSINELDIFASNNKIKYYRAEIKDNFCLGPGQSEKLLEFDKKSPGNIYTFSDSIGIKIEYKSQYGQVSICTNMS
jgi:hypothetical protein